MKFVRIMLMLLIGLTSLDMAQPPQQRAEAVTNTVLLSTLNSSQWGYYVLCSAPCFHPRAAVEFSTPATPNYTVNHVEVMLFSDVGGYAASVALWKGSGGVPSALVSTIGTATVTTFGHHTVGLDTNLVLAPSTTYYLVVEGMSGYGGWDFMLNAPPVGPLTLGASQADGSSGWIASAYTLGFELSYTAPEALASHASCNGTSLNINITDGDGPYNITGTGPGLPTTSAAEGTINLSGPGVWSNVTVTETDGNSETVNLGGFDCTTGLAATGVCDRDNLTLSITAGDGPFNITGTGPGLPMTGVLTGNLTLTGPGVWSNVTVTETTGNLQATSLGGFNCATNGLTVAAACNVDNLNVTITAGDGPFNITGNGPGLPMTGVLTGHLTLTGPGTWTGVTVTETTGNTQATALGDFNCATHVLTVTAGCQIQNMLLTIGAGDGPFNITGNGPGLPMTGVLTGNLTLTGPGTWTGVTVTETTGNRQSFAVGTLTCNYPYVPGITVRNLGLVMITGEQFQPAYYTPNGAVARGSDGVEIWLPADADGNWYDTYVVADVQEVDGEIWLGLFVGNVNWAYVRLADVTVIVPIQGVD